jgi:hypothetical protein
MLNFYAVCFMPCASKTSVNQLVQKIVSGRALMKLTPCHFFDNQDVLQWHEDHSGQVGISAKLNADCMIHAALEDDKVDEPMEGEGQADY